MSHIRTVLPAAFLIALAVTPAVAADRAAFLAHCEKDVGAAEKSKCACMADKIDTAFKDKAHVFAYQSMAKPIGELVNVESGLTEKEEDDIVDKSFAFMKECGLVK
jgi:hypothetical protein